MALDTHRRVGKQVKLIREHALDEGNELQRVGTSGLEGEACELPRTFERLEHLGRDHCGACERERQALPPRSKVELDHGHEPRAIHIADGPKAIDRRGSIGKSARQSARKAAVCAYACIHARARIHTRARIAPVHLRARARITAVRQHRARVCMATVRWRRWRRR